MEPHSQDLSKLAEQLVMWLSDSLLTESPTTAQLVEAANVAVANLLSRERHPGKDRQVARIVGRAVAKVAVPHLSAVKVLELDGKILRILKRRPLRGVAAYDALQSGWARVLLLLRVGRIDPSLGTVQGLLWRCTLRCAADEERMLRKYDASNEFIEPDVREEFDGEAVLDRFTTVNLPFVEVVFHRLLEEQRTHELRMTARLHDGEHRLCPTPDQRDRWLLISQAAARQYVDNLEVPVPLEEAFPPAKLETNKELAAALFQPIATRMARFALRHVQLELRARHPGPKQRETRRRLRAYLKVLCGVDALRVSRRLGWDTVQDLRACVISRQHYVDKMRGILSPLGGVDAVLYRASAVA